MKYLKLVFSLLILLLTFSCTKDCTEWYSGVDLRGVTKSPNNNQKINGWYETNYLVDELNFWIVYSSSADGYEGCKSKTRIHELVKSGINIFCSSQIMVGSDIIEPNTNLYQFFDLIQQDEGNDILSFDRANFAFPKFSPPLSISKLKFLYQMAL